VRENEIPNTLFKSIQDLYQDRKIEISVKDIEDTTDYLLRSEENRELLFEGMEAAKTRHYVHTMTFDELDAMVQ
jgi:hypothetical protein